MQNLLFDSFNLLKRHIRASLRLPIWIAVTLVQPIIWITIFGQLFQRVVEIPGFEGASYIAFLTPGIVIMTAMFGSAWSGMGLIYDLHTGVLDRMLSTPVNRTAIIVARVLHASITVLVQSLIILALGFFLGSNISSGVLGIAGVLISAILIGAGFAAISSGIALLTKKEETMIAIINFFGLPLTFLSAAFMSNDLMPKWMQSISILNPVNWAVEAARNAMAGSDWFIFWINCSLLFIFTFLSVVFASQAFRIYRRLN